MIIQRPFLCNLTIPYSPSSLSFHLKERRKKKLALKILFPETFDLKRTTLAIVREISTYLSGPSPPVLHTFLRKYNRTSFLLLLFGRGRTEGSAERIFCIARTGNPLKFPRKCQSPYTSYYAASPTTGFYSCQLPVLAGDLSGLSSLKVIVLCRNLPVLLVQIIIGLLTAFLPSHLLLIPI